ncbi:flagellar basal body rod protein FlgB [Bacillus luteolus]|uniref:Flagellar basal body rod protein FlgB n=1 Tax=Litchfieldia luteola TaxID=682179 RepID=A0ABR9QJR2_9BACI|nr:flagellar basal body rod protein FlgB [Cytobacillus luteolus]MBE4908735.1 flagellar basal body rod protein FlgB [Cytobacillus luteolus]MBP1941594.1 flagellar basal-body rod protein FlgB [Cytobacillus luteolus]
MKLFSSTITTLEQAMNYSTAKQKVISHNIANSDTPNYKTKSVSFNSEFSRVLKDSMQANKTDIRHYDFKSTNSKSFSVFTKNSSSYNHNGNNVDIDKEMTELAKNQIYYNAVADRIGSKFNSLKTVIRGGK